MATKAAKEDLPQLQRSIASLKGHLTHLLDQVAQFLMDPICSMTQGLILSYDAELVKMHGTLEEAVGKAIIWKRPQ